MDNLQLAQKIKILCKSKKITVKSLLESCGINRNFIYDLEKKTQAPSADKLESIANYLDCSVDYLLGRTDTPLTENEQLLLDIIRELDDDKKQLLFETAKAMANKN